MNATSSGKIDRRPQRTRRFALMATIVALGVGIGGCGGGGGSGANGLNSPVSTGAPGSPTGTGVWKGPTGTVAVTITDVFGEPVDGASVSVSHHQSGDHRDVVADADGRVTLANFPAGPLSVSAADWKGSESVENFIWRSGTVTLPENGHLELAGTVRPQAEPLVATPAAWIEASKLAADGRTVDLSFHLLQLPEVGPFRLFLRRCEPDSQNDSPVHQPDCVAGPSGLDAPYEAPNSGIPLSIGTAPGGPLAPFTVALLLDQSRSIFVNDPSDARLFAVKYFLTTLRADDRVVLTAFASDDFAAGHRTQLPQTPVTMFPGESPRFAAADHSLFPTIDSLGSLEGGAAPLYAAIDTMLDFTAANAPANGQRAVVVLTDGQDDTCGSPAECELALLRVIEKSRATGVAIVTVVLPSPTGQVDAVALNQLADGSGGAALWLTEPRQLATAFGALRHVLDGNAQMYTARYRIESSTDGAFQPGRTVLGTLAAEMQYFCPFDCFYIDVPFAVRIP